MVIAGTIAKHSMGLFINLSKFNDDKGRNKMLELSVYFYFSTSQTHERSIRRISLIIISEEE